MCTSVPQIPVLRTRIRTSLIPTSGPGTSPSQETLLRPCLDQCAYRPRSLPLRGPDDLEDGARLISKHGEPADVGQVERLQQHLAAQLDRLPAGLVGVGDRGRRSTSAAARLQLRHLVANAGDAPALDLEDAERLPAASRGRPRRSRSRRPARRRQRRGWGRRSGTGSSSASRASLASCAPMCVSACQTPKTAPVGSCAIVIRPESKTSNGSTRTVPPASRILRAVWSTSSLAR